ncbi:MAG: RdgB/HAM1 family non-canonical purine NTP pyrophosphatase [Saprospiraceae bacterium]
MDLLFATQNKNKSKELKELLLSYQYNVLDLNDIGVNISIEETGATLHENAQIKAEFLYNLTKSIVLSEDSGLEVDILKGRPGVRSARYAGEKRSDMENMIKVLDELSGEKNREAQFRTVIALYDGQTCLYFEGIVRGNIAVAPKGNSGFGYDPIFIPDEYSQTFAELSSDEKNKISHRGKAVEKLLIYLKEKRYQE